MSEHIKKSHNKTLLLYHIVFPVRFRREVLTEAVKETLKEVCEGISEGYEIYFVEVGMDEDHVHFLVQSIPMNSVTMIVKTIKSLTARYIFLKNPEVKRKLWGGKFWTSGYYVNTVGAYGNEEVIKKYVSEQGLGYTELERKGLTLFH